jgi:carboxypeptidase family protein
MRLLAFFCLTAAVACGQSLAGEIRLEVKDATGAAIEASGLIEGLATGVHRDYQTDARGTHTFTGLPFGTYRLQIGRDGFAAQSVRVDVRSEAPIQQTVTLAVAVIATTVEVSDAVTLVNPQATSAAQYIRPEELRDRESGAPGRSFIDLVNQQPGWLLEANGVLHPRGSEYQVQYVVDGIPLYDNRSPAFAQSLGVDEFDSMNVRTAGFPAEFGRSLGGVVELNTNHDAVPGLHGQMSYQGGSFDQQSGFASLQYSRGRNAVSLSGEGFLTDRYLDAPVEQNYTNHASGGALSARFDRTWSTADSTHGYVSSRHTGFLVPDEQLQQAAGQRQDRTAGETLGQVSHTHLFNARVLMQVRGMVRDTSALLWSNSFSIPILPTQDRGFREGYLGGSVSVTHGSHELKAGADALLDSIHENFAYLITAYKIGTVQIFDRDVPQSFQFSGQRDGRQQSAFVQDQWHKGPLTLSAGLRFDHYGVVADETGWSPRLGAAYSIPKAGLVLRASYDRIFQSPAMENLLLASADLSAQLGGGAFLPLRPSRGDYFEAGFAKSILGKLRLDGSWYRRVVDHFADDDLLLNTGVSFPITFSHAEISGFEAKLELPHWGPVSGFMSYSNLLGRGRLPVAGGLLLGDDAQGLVGGAGSFPITQDQRNSFRGKLRVQARRRLWFALESEYNSGLPIDLNVADMAFLRQQYGAAILSKVNFERGRVRPSASFDASAGVSLYQVDRKSVRLQADVFNLFDRLNVIDFAGVLSGTALQAGRNFAVRLNASF